MAAVGDSPRSALTAVGGQEVGTLRFEEPDYASSNWYFSREEIERNSPSRRDGIDSKKESYFRRSYCTFCQDVGMRLKVPQLTIATAIVFCHRFFLRQSHRLNDRFMIATICIFLAGKVEETPRPLKDVILVSYEVRHKKDPVALQKIKQKEVFEQQREMVLVGERLVLQTLGFDLNIHHPYKPLIAAVKKLGTAQSLLAQVAWNFVNDGLRTSLCLQFKPHHIAAGAIFLAAKFLKVKLPSEGDRTWWQEFGVTPKQLEEVSSQMLELYEHQGAAGGGGESTGPPGQSQSQAAQSQSVNQPSRAHIVQQSQPPPPPPPPPPPQPPQPAAPAAVQLKPELQQQPRSPLRSRHKVVAVHASEPLLQFQDGRPVRPISPAARAQANLLDAAREHHQTPKGGVGCTPPGASLPPTSNGNALVDSKPYDRRDAERSRAPLENGVGERGSPRERVDARRWKPYKKPEEEVPVRRDPEDGLPEVSPQLPRGKPPGDADRVVKVHGERVEVEDAGDRGQGFPEERGEVQNRIDPGSEDERNEREPEENEEEMWELIEQVEVNDGPKKPRGKKNADKRRLPGVVKSKELLEMVSPRRRRVSGMEVKKEDEEEGELGAKKRGEDGEEMKKEKASPRMDAAAAEKRKSADVTEGREREKVEEGELPTLVVAKERRAGTASASDGSPARPSPSDASGRSRDRGGYHSSSRYDRHYYGRDHYHRHVGHGGGGGPGLGGSAGSAYRYRHGDGVDRDRVDRHRHRDREWPGDVEDHRHKKGRYEH